VLIQADQDGRESRSSDTHLSCGVQEMRGRAIIDGLGRVVVDPVEYLALIWRMDSMTRS